MSKFTNLETRSPLNLTQLCSSCSVAQLCPTLRDPGFPVLQQLPELAQTHVH